MTDLNTLRPEVREAINRTDITVEMFDTLVTVNRDDYDIVRAELLRLADENAELHTSALVGYEDGWHALRNERDALKAELAALKSQTFRGRAQDAIDRFAGGEELSHEEMCEVVNQAVCAERELAALKARIAKAPTAQLIDQGRVTQQWYVRATDGSLLALPPALSGKHVRLVVEE